MDPKIRAAVDLSECRRPRGALRRVSASGRARAAAASASALRPNFRPPANATDLRLWPGKRLAPGALSQLRWPFLAPVKDRDQLKLLAPDAVGDDKGGVGNHELARADDSARPAYFGCD